MHTIFLFSAVNYWIKLEEAESPPNHPLQIFIKFLYQLCYFV